MRVLAALFTLRGVCGEMNDGMQLPLRRFGVVRHGKSGAHASRLYSSVVGRLDPELAVRAIVDELSAPDPELQANGVVVRFADVTTAAAHEEEVRRSLPASCGRVTASGAGYYFTLPSRELRGTLSGGASAWLPWATCWDTATLLEESLRHLQNIPDVLMVQPTHVIRTMNLDATASIWGSADVDNSVSVGANGTGVLVIVGDTGLFANHHRYTAGGQTRRPRQLEISIDENGVTCAGVTSVNDQLRVEPQEGPATTYFRFRCDQPASCGWYGTDFVSGTNDHGTHVSGSVLDSAPGAKLAVLDMQNLANHGNSYIVHPPSLYWQSLHRPSTCAGMGAPDERLHTVFSFSWGSHHSGRYTDTDSQVDLYLWNHPTTSVTAAAGNNGAYYGYRVLSPCTAKNAVCVGARVSPYAFFARCGIGGPDHQQCWQTGSQYYPRFNPDASTIDYAECNLMDFSSTGPAADGRQKPDVATHGAYLLSDYSPGAHTPYDGSTGAQRNSMQGTSMATPLLAGALARLADLLRGDNRICDVSRSSTVADACILRFGAAAPADRIAAAPVSSSLLRAVVRALSVPPQHVVGVSSNAGYLFHYAYAGTPGQRTHGEGCLDPAAAASALAQVVSIDASSTREFDNADGLVSTDGQASAFTVSGVAPSDGSVVIILTWNDYPAFPGLCRPSCLINDLALSAVITQDLPHVAAVRVFGGAALNVVDNSETIVAAVSGPFNLSIQVFPLSLNPVSLLTQPQRFSVAARVDAAEDLALEAAAPCANAELLRYCQDAVGVGDRPCGAASAACTTYVQCFSSVPYRMWPSASGDRCVTESCPALFAQRQRCVRDCVTSVVGCCCPSGQRLKCALHGAELVYLAPSIDPDTGSSNMDYCEEFSEDFVRYGDAWAAQAPFAALGLCVSMLVW